MFHEDILKISYLKYIKTKFMISNMHCKELHLNNFKDDFLNISIFLHPQIPDLLILSYHNKPYINGNIIYFRELTLMTGFVVQGHILCNLLAFLIK